MITQIYEGTNQIQRVVMARLLKYQRGAFSLVSVVVFCSYTAISYGGHPVAARPSALIISGCGITFEHVDTRGLRTVDGIAEIAGNYPSAGGGERAAWFRDSEGNLFGIGQATPPPHAGN